MYKMLGSKKEAETSKLFHCDICDYSTCRRFNFNKHLETDKHKNATLEGKVAKPQNTMAYLCPHCNASYKTHGGMWKHKQKCAKNKNSTFMPIYNDNGISNMIVALLKQNNLLIEQHNKIVEQSQNNHQHTSNTVETMYTTINNTSNKFNINVFLNETCKDAINLTEFVEQITLSLEDLEETSKVGYVEGISNIFIRNLKDMYYKQRPIHCNDYKREVLYIKDDNKWTKDGKEKLTNAIKIIANKNIKQISNWQKAYPDYNNPKSKQNEKYIKMLYEVMSGSSKEEQTSNYGKIIKNISKEVIIDKSDFK